ncbi:hypothetical protein B0T09DRAFT_412929 [Sordaria sp. MPI-SDFR-AT-0083]|nr:hypothetical protein B0T09DRAFT_412929 [Sordaria sp. MPI-SDFR-AT-0083]
MSTPPDRPFFHIGLLMLKQFMERDELTLQDRQKCWKIIDSIYHNFSSLDHDQLIRSSFRELDHHRRSLEAIVEMVQDPLDNPQLSDDRILAGFDFAKEVYRNARTSEDILKLAALILAARLRGRRHTRYLGKEEVHPQVQRARHMSKLSKLAPSWDIAIHIDNEHVGTPFTAAYSHET